MKKPPITCFCRRALSALDAILSLTLRAMIIVSKSSLSPSVLDCWSSERKAKTDQFVCESMLKEVKAVRTGSAVNTMAVSLATHHRV